jgi:RHH-type proline utilization regulon transcriptional repressor/proline dehydrogenase/delta 1-pyrroline-5-carboxylate dehydrogenase
LVTLKQVQKEARKEQSMAASRPKKLKTLRDNLLRAIHADEDEAVAHLLAGLGLKKTDHRIIEATAHKIVSQSRAMRTERGTLDAFLQEFGLSNQEGVALMCLAEALLRIPDSETQDLLIAEKIVAGDWGEHRGQSESPFVNASVWALMMTGGVIKLDEKITANPASWAKSFVSKVGEPVIREATLAAMRIMGRQFVYGRTINEALSRRSKEGAEDHLMSFDMLGEGARTALDAQRYQDLYKHAIQKVGEAAHEEGVGHQARSSVSIKLSALHPRYEAVKSGQLMSELLPRIEELAFLSREYGIAMTIDAEETDRLDISLTIFENLARNPRLADWPGLGLAVQAYQKNAPYVIDWLIELSKDTGRRFPIRLVKGAYWDTEIKHAQELGFADYPVWTRKATTDVCYIHTAQKMLEVPDAIYPQFASHNAHTIATIAHLAGDREFEYQRLHGMGELMYRAVRDTIGTEIRIRTYAPVGRHEDLLPYLVRRLLENGANSSFVNRFMDAQVPIEIIVANPVDLITPLKNKRHGAIPTPRELYGDRKNSSGVDLSNRLEADALLAGISKQAKAKYKRAALVSGLEVKGKSVESRSPIDGHLVGKVRDADGDDIDRAITDATAAQPAWDATGGVGRAEILERLGDLFEEDRARFIDLMSREGGKTVKDGIAELREAADFCRYYAREARTKFEEPAVLKGPTGESNQISLHGRGVFACISPWNFPLAIFSGQIAAALAAGNSVVAKPAGQTPLIGIEATKLFHKAGVPSDVLHLLAGDGRTVGAAMVEDPRVRGVAFTGSTAVAKGINQALAAKDGPISTLIAETGGQNAMIVDSSALAEQVTDDVMASAFSSAGQRCSALRVLFIQDSVADPMLEMLKGALAEFEVGDPQLLSTDMGPVIDARSLQDLEAHRAFMEREAKLIARGQIDKGMENGSFFAPHIFEIPDLSILEDEVFGPILHVVRYSADNMTGVLDSIRATGFGLTFGVHSRIEERWLDLFSASSVGNTYVNRNMIGAVVGVQPFGGEGLSGTGPKAGGPNYLQRFSTERVLSINTTATGGNIDLFRLEEGDD